MQHYLDNLTDRDKALLGYATIHTANEIFKIKDHKDFAEVDWHLLTMHISTNIISVIEGMGKDDIFIAKMIKTGTTWYLDAKEYEKSLKGK